MPCSRSRRRPALRPPLVLPRPEGSHVHDLRRRDTVPLRALHQVPAAEIHLGHRSGVDRWRRRHRRVPGRGAVPVADRRRPARRAARGADRSRAASARPPPDHGPGDPARVPRGRAGDPAGVLPAGGLRRRRVGVGVPRPARAGGARGVRGGAGVHLASPAVPHRRRVARRGGLRPPRAAPSRRGPRPAAAGPPPGRPAGRGAPPARDHAVRAGGPPVPQRPPDHRVLAAHRRALRGPGRTAGRGEAVGVGRRARRTRRAGRGPGGGRRTGAGPGEPGGLLPPERAAARRQRRSVGRRAPPVGRSASTAPAAADRARGAGPHGGDPAGRAGERAGRVPLPDRGQDDRQDLPELPVPALPAGAERPRGRRRGRSRPRHPPARPALGGSPTSWAPPPSSRAPRGSASTGTV